MTGPGKRVALIATLAVVWVAIANVGAWFYLQRYPVNPGVTRVWQKWQLLERLPAPVDWVFVGDSACGAGISPDAVETVLDGRAVNLCTIANASVVNQAWQVARYVERFGPPKGVVVLNTFHTWERSADDLVGMLSQIPKATRLRHQPDLTLWQKLRYYTSPLMTLYSQDASVRYVLSGLFSSQARSAPEDSLRYVLASRGHVPENTPRPAVVERQTRETIASHATRTFVLSQQSAEALQALQNLAASAGFRLYIANTSIARDLFEDARFERYYRSMNAALARAVQGGPARLILQTPPTFGSHEMDNIDHVVGTAAVQRFSIEVGRAVATELASSP